MSKETLWPPFRNITIYFCKANGQCWADGCKSSVALYWDSRTCSFSGEYANHSSLFGAKKGAVNTHSGNQSELCENSVKARLGGEVPTKALRCHGKEETWTCILNQICLSSEGNRSGKEGNDSCLYTYSAFFLNYWLQKVQRRYKSLSIFHVFFLGRDLKTLYSQADFFFSF